MAPPLLWTWAVVFALPAALTDVAKELEDGAPRSVLVNATGPDSFVISWAPPNLPTVGPVGRLQAYSLVYRPAESAQYDYADDMEEFLPPVTRTKTVTNLKEDTKYHVILSAVYDPYQKVPAPLFTIKTDGVAHGDQLLSELTKESSCNCSEPGSSSACPIPANATDCPCFLGYTGRWCDRCELGFYPSAKQCVPCPCSNDTSTGECELDGEMVTCTRCLPGHRGELCDTCSAGFRWEGGRCVPHECRSYTYCLDKPPGTPGCRDCRLVPDPPVADRAAAADPMDNELADGSVPLIAVLATLGVILLAVGLGSCYRYWTHQRHRPRLPFWSLELSPPDPPPPECQYRHLAPTGKPPVSYSAIQI